MLTFVKYHDILRSIIGVGEGADRDQGGATNEKFNEVSRGCSHFADVASAIRAGFCKGQDHLRGGGFCGTRPRRT